MTLTRLRPERTLAELFLTPTEQNLQPLAVYSIIMDWVDIVVQTTDLLVQALKSAQEARRSPSPEEKQRLITFVKRVLGDFYQDLASLFRDYDHKWRARYVADAAEIQSHIRACTQSLDPKAHLRLNINLIHHAVAENTEQLISKQSRQILSYAPESSLILRFEKSGKHAKAHMDELEDALLQLVGV